MVNTAQDAYLAVRQAALEKVAGMPPAQIGKAILGKPYINPTMLTPRSYRVGNALRRGLGYTAGALALGSAGYGAYRYLTDKDSNFNPFLGVGGSFARDTINRYNQ